MRRRTVLSLAVSCSTYRKATLSIFGAGQIVLESENVLFQSAELAFVEHLQMLFGFGFVLSGIEKSLKKNDGLPSKSSVDVLLEWSLIHLGHSSDDLPACVLW